MKAIISTTYDDKYLFFLPIVTWAWNKIGVDVIWFAPNVDYNLRACLVFDTLVKNNLSYDYKQFDCPQHKEATYAQCSRLYAAAIKDLPEDEILVTSDADMIVFEKPDYNGGFLIFGADLVPPGQYPMCYISASVKNWRVLIGEENTYQQHLDELLGPIEAEHFRGNYWGKDQETAYNLINPHKAFFVEKNRAGPGTQFASNRYDRDDAYLLERLSSDTIDFHLPRPGYEPHNFGIILEVLKYHYLNDNFDWLIEYTEQYKKLLL